MNLNRIGHIEKLKRYPVKSMAGMNLDETVVGWHGLPGDRRIGILDSKNQNGFPWISASRLPELLLYTPCDADESSSEMNPTQVLTPNGEKLEIFGEPLRREIESKIGKEIELINLKHGIFDDAPISIIATSTIDRVCQQAGVEPDERRFRANLVLKLYEPTPFAEDSWVGQVISIGNTSSAPAIHITKRDVRCKMIGLDPNSGEHNPSVIKAATHLNDNHAGVYGTVVKPGTIRLGAPVYRV